MDMLGASGDFGDADSSFDMTFPFPEHLALFDAFLADRAEIVARIEESLLNVRGKETARRRDRSFFDRTLNACFFAAPGISPELSRLQGQLAASHVADGFEPVQIDKFADQFDPLDLIIRAYEYWDAHRWPGRSSRLNYAQTIYSALLLRQFEYFSLRMWDEGNERASERLQAIQALLDRLNDVASVQAFVRDLRWLVQTAQGALTKHLEPYFRIAQHVAGSFTEVERLGFHAAGAKLAGGHLRSQLRYRALEADLPIAGPVNLAIARNSNSMDCALLVRDLVPLLKAYEQACSNSANTDARIELADAILQGVSADPELFLARLDLLGPCTMIEDLFVERPGDGSLRFSTLGYEQAVLLEQYCDLIGRLAGSLWEDAAVLASSFSEGAYSPFGICYGFVADMLSNIANCTLVSSTAAALSLEDMFRSRGELNAKSAWAQVWAELPRRKGERDHFYYSTEFAAQNFARLMAALDARASRKTELNTSGAADAQIYISTESGTPQDGALPAGAVMVNEHCYTSDAGRAAASGMTAMARSQILLDRNEGRYLASAECGGEWFAVSKVILTLFTSRGADVMICGVPAEISEILRMTCPGLIVTPATGD
jgi:hypothetical protein